MRYRTMAFLLALVGLVACTVLVVGEKTTAAPTVATICTVQNEAIPNQTRIAGVFHTPAIR